MTSAASRTRRDLFFLVSSALFLAFVLGGFTPTFYARPAIWPTEAVLARHGPSLPAYLSLHGLLLTAWFVLAFVQTCLVAAHRTDLHRKLGIVGVVLASGIVPISILTTVLRDAPVIDQAPWRGFGQLVTITTFSICIVAGVYLRDRPADHRRLMWFASLSLIAPAIDRSITTVAYVTGWFPADRGPVWAGYFIVGLLLVMVGRDLIIHRRPHRGTMWGLAAISVAIVTTIVVIRSGTWAAGVRMLA